MKSLIIIVQLLLIFLAGMSQPIMESIEVYTGEELNMRNDIKIAEIFGHDERGYYAHTLDHRDGIEFLDTEFRSVKREYLDLMDGFRNRTLLALFHFHDTIYMFTSEQRVRRMLLFVETIDKNTLLQNGDERTIMDVENLSGWISEFGFKLSRQENKLLVFSRLDVYSKNIQDYHFEMYSEGLKLNWEADQRIVYPQRAPRESIVKVNEEGDVFIMSLQDDQKLSSLWNAMKNRYHLLALTEKGRYNNTYLLDFPELYIRGIHIEPGSGQDLSICGFYSPTHFRAMIDGVFYMELDNEAGQFRNQVFYEFEPWFLTEAIAQDPKKTPEELFSFRLRHMVRRNNGDFIVLAENEFDQDYDTYQNIIAMCFSPGGSLNWKRVIPKRQGIDPYIPFNHSSYQVHAPWNSDKTYLIFNDNIKNGEWPAEDEIKSFHPNSPANLKVVGIGISGELSSSIIYRKTKRRMKTPVPLQYYDMLNHEMVIPSIRFKLYNYMKISFNE
ncbi:hypothetical protein ACFLTA_06980 [Bacteroidota bacterium]